MISYNDYIKLMEDRGYSLRDNKPIEIHELSPGIHTFSVKKGDIGKFLEIECLFNTIMSACGKNHPGGSPEQYTCNIKCFDEENKEPFQEYHQFIQLTSTQGTVADIIATKILHKEIDKIENIQEWEKSINPILKIIRSENNYEYPIWAGNYKTFHQDFLNNSLNIYSGEKIIFYALKPDIDIVRVIFSLQVDIFERNFKNSLI